MDFMKKIETSISGDKYKNGVWFIGIDEVGRGPLAGPVTVGGVAVFVKGDVDPKGNFSQNFDLRSNPGLEILKKYPIGIDSKKMKERDRDSWYEVIQKIQQKTRQKSLQDKSENDEAENSKTESDFGLIAVTQSYNAKQIDTKGIAVCIADLVDLNIKKILNIIQSMAPETQLTDFRVLLDGGLKTRLIVENQETIIKGDEKELLISLASVYAKVTRDMYMKNISKNPKYIEYGFEVHKGYGTLKHRQAISKKGLSDEHRRTFCTSIPLASR